MKASAVPSCLFSTIARSSEPLWLNSSRRGRQRSQSVRLCYNNARFVSSRQVTQYVCWRQHQIWEVSDDQDRPLLLWVAARGGERRTVALWRLSLHGVPTAYRLGLRRQHLFPERAGAHRGAEQGLCARQRLGRKIEFHFCPDCGTSVFWYAEGRADDIGIAFGTFADPSMPWPTLSVWGDDAASVGDLRSPRQSVSGQSQPTLNRRASC
jgi:Glutathione-dependent formaldehyde-activating enzyme